MTSHRDVTAGIPSLARGLIRAIIGLVTVNDSFKLLAPSVSLVSSVRVSSKEGGDFPLSRDVISVTSCCACFYL